MWVCLCRSPRSHTMMGRLVHYAADALMVSTILAGVKHSTGTTLDTTKVTEPNVRSAVQYYLSAGEFLFNRAVSFAQGSQFFRPAEPINPLSIFNQDSSSNLRQYSHQDPPNQNHNHNHMPSRW